MSGLCALCVNSDGSVFSCAPRKHMWWAQLTMTLAVSEPRMLLRMSVVGCVETAPSAAVTVTSFGTTTT